MSIQKKSLISALKTTKKANVASAPEKPSVESGARMVAVRMAKKTSRMAARKVARYAKPL